MNKKHLLTISIVALCSQFTHPIATAEASKHTLAKHHSGTHHKATKQTTVAHYSRNKHTHHVSYSSIISNGDSKQGKASWYSSKLHGRRTASGEKYDMYAMTAAHMSLPLLSYAEVTNLENHRSVVVRINDRGPFHGHRVLDLSYAAAKELGITNAGTGTVKITPIVVN